jgi:hypothetical protein
MIPEREGEVKREEAAGPGRLKGEIEVVKVSVNSTASFQESTDILVTPGCSTAILR